MRHLYFFQGRDKDQAPVFFSNIVIATNRQEAIYKLNAELGGDWRERTSAVKLEVHHVE